MNRLGAKVGKGEGSARRPWQVVGVVEAEAIEDRGDKVTGPNRSFGREATDSIAGPNNPSALNTATGK